MGFESGSGCRQLSAARRGRALQTVTFGPLTVSVLRNESVNGALHYVDEGGEQRDRTGLLTWPATYAMGHYLVHLAPQLKSATVLELGAGAGLVGMVLGALCRRAILTDNHPDVLRLLEFNVQQQGAGVLACCHLEWGSAESASQCPLYPHGADFIVGSDIVYPDTNRFLGGLFDTVDWLLAPSPSSALILSYVQRTRPSTRQLFQTAALKGFDFVGVPWGEYMAERPMHDAVILRFTRQTPIAPTDEEALKRYMERAKAVFPNAWEDEVPEEPEVFVAPFADFGGPSTDLW
eukprot:GGOE01000691.1.p1 GENE.GGOE01000691.1~~GGOE01000691.1.p1  ORF type:complete len:292 (+),score=81.51 GGOE01000691.1:134-1009(+)